MNTLLAYTSADRWAPGIGDPTVLGWITVACYFGAAALCWSAARRPGCQVMQSERFFWLGFAGLLLLLGVNKQLDLQTWFTLTAKQWAKAGGWYAQRRFVQGLFVGFVAIVGTLSLAGLWLLTRRAAHQTRIALAGGVFLLGFIVIRAASFHYVDRMLGLHIGALRMNHVLEIGGTIGIAVAALLTLRSGRKQVGPGGPEQFVLAGPGHGAL